MRVGAAEAAKEKEAEVIEAGSGAMAMEVVVDLVGKGAKEGL